MVSDDGSINPARDRYLKALYKLQRQRRDEPVPMGDLAQALAIAPGTATAMMKRLATDELVTYQPYSGVRLSSTGRRLALQLVRRHRLLECFLIEVLGYEWSDVHADAERLELGVSATLLERIDAFLGHPMADPHGNPIPRADGSLVMDDAIALSECQAGQHIQFIRIGELTPDCLDLLARSGWRPATTGRVLSNDPIAETVSIQADGREPLTVGRAVAHDIFVDVV